MCLFGSFLGLHNWYLGNYKRALLFTLTGGGFGIWWISDLIKIAIDHDFIKNCNGGYKEQREAKRGEALEKMNAIREKNMLQKIIKYVVLNVEALN